MFLDDRLKHILEITITPLAIETDGIFYPAFRISNKWEDEQCLDPITGEVNNPLATTKFTIPCDDESHAMNYAISFAAVRVRQIKQSMEIETKRAMDYLQSPERQAEIDKARAYFDAKRAKHLEDSPDFSSPNLIDWLPGAMNMRFGTGRCSSRPVFQVPNKKDEGESDE